VADDNPAIAYLAALLAVFTVIAALASARNATRD